MKHLIACMAAFAAAQFGAEAQIQRYGVCGTVADSTGIGTPYATLHIYQLPDSIKPVVTAVTTDEGVFDVGLDRAGSYTLTASAVGMSPVKRAFEIDTETPVADLGVITMGLSSQLDEVVVTAAKPLISRQIDRIAYDVAADPDAQSSQLDEMLKKVPMVTVEADGSIKVKGSTSFQIYKNGRKNNSFTNNAKDIFRSIPASMIKSIEVITDPGAREDAEGVGTILNIVTIEDMVIKGVAGSAGLQWRSTNYLPNPNLWLLTQIDKVTVNVYGNFNHRPYMEEVHRTDRIYNESGNRSHSEQWLSSRYATGSTGLEMSWELDSLNLITAEFDAYFYNRPTRARGEFWLNADDGSTIYSYDTRRLSDPSRGYWLGGNVNYQRLTRRQGEKIILSYRISGNGSHLVESNVYSNMVQMPFDYTGIDYDNRGSFTEHTFQADWSRPLAKGHTLDVGAKYIFRDNHSDSHQTYIGSHDYESDYSHLTHVAAVYADYRLNIGRWGLRAGARYEYSRLSADFKDGSSPDYHSSLNDVVPNVAMSFGINDNNSVRLSYSSSIRRPGISYLNPAVTSNPQSVACGNGNLTSSRYHSANMNYSMFGRKLSLDFNLGYSFCNNTIIQIQSLLPDDRTFQTYANAGRSHQLYAGLWGQLQAGAKTRLMVNASLSYDRESNPSARISYKGLTPSVWTRVNQTLPWKLTATASLSYWSQSKSLYNVFELQGASRFNHSIELSRIFLKSNRLNVRLAVYNPFGTSRQKSHSYMVNVPYHSESWSSMPANRMFQIGVSYRFGNLNAKVRKVRSVTNNDIVGSAAR